jgi:hypothetical protein
LSLSECDDEGSWKSRTGLVSTVSCLGVKLAVLQLPKLSGTLGDESFLLTAYLPQDVYESSTDAISSHFSTQVTPDAQIVKCG